MSETNSNGRHDFGDTDISLDEGGLRAPPGLSPLRKAWWWFDFLILVKLARLRFIGLLLLIGLIIIKWDTINAYYDRWTRPTGEGHASGSDFEFYCPMHPTVIRENSKDKCPICFMPLSKRKKGDNTEEALPPGVVNRVQLSPYRVVLAGIQTWKVEYLPLTKEITTVGFVEFNERQMKHVAARVKGRIDTLFVNETGQMVHAGDALASLYSPDLVVTVENLLDAKKSGNVDLLKMANNRLQLWGISKDQIDEILQSGMANSHLKIRTPIDGHILKKYVKEGQYVDEGSPLYDVVDLSSVWIQAQVYEGDMVFLPVTHHSLKAKEAKIAGIPVSATTPAMPGRTFDGKLTFIFPHVDQDTRTVMVRFELNNPDHVLRPGTTAMVKLSIPPKQIDVLSKAISKEGLVLSVPESAVIDTGSLRLVYREVMPGEFEGVKVELGPRMVGPKDIAYYPVLQGLAHGDNIVAAGSFLIDAETRLNPAAGSIYFGGSGGKSQSGVTVRPSTPDDEEAKVTATLAKLTPEDRRLAEAQKFCPILKDTRLGSMGVPEKHILDGTPVFLCCKGCEKAAKTKSKEAADTVNALRKANGKPESK